MPGIVGLITAKPAGLASEELRRMLASSSNESFYVTGSWSDESLGIYVGWRALKNSFADAMPLLNETGDVCLIFSGEDFPDPELLGGLRSRGHQCGPARSSYLVHRYEEESDFPAGLNGMFHGVIADRRRATITLFNDRFGMHRLVWHRTNDAFYFAAEAKAILAVRPELRVADQTSLGEFVACSCVLENRTIFKGISVLPQGSAWTFCKGDIARSHTYFRSDEWEQQQVLPPEQYYQQIAQTLTRTLPRYFEGPERIALALTGGLDTRVIMASYNALPGALPCYTFGGMRRDSEDVRVARRVAAVAGQTHEVIRIDRDFLNEFGRYAERTIELTEGGIDVYRASDLYVSKKAREIAPVKVVGTYGSEIIRRVVNLTPVVPADGLYAADFRPLIARAAETCSELRRLHPVTFAAFRQSPWQHAGLLELEQTQLTVRSPYMDNQFVQAAYRAPRLNGSGDIRLRLVDDQNPALSTIRTDRGAAGRSSRVAAWPVRTLLELTVKAEYAYDDGMPQWLARVDGVLKPLHLESLFLGRHKASHFRLWYMNELADYVCGILLDPRSLARPYVARRGVEAIVHGHLSARSNYTTAIHKLLTLELLHRRFLDG